MDHIDTHLATAAIENKYPLAIKAALAIGKKLSTIITTKLTIQKFSELLWVRYSSYLKILLNLSYLFLVLHPRHKVEYFKNANWSDEWIEEATQIVRDKFELSYGSLDDSWATSIKKVRTIPYFLL